MTDHELPPAFRPWIDSFALSLRAKGRSHKTRRIYTDAVTRFGQWLLDREWPRETAVAGWEDVKKIHVELYMAWHQEEGTKCGCGAPRSHRRQTCPKGKPYEPGYANNQYRALQQWWRWYCDEEGTPNPMAGLSPPSVGDTVVPVLSLDELAQLLKACDGRDFTARRDAALIRMYASSGSRLTEVAALDTADLNLQLFEALVTGKGNRQRIVKFDARCAQAIDRYLRLRARHPQAQFTSRLWLGPKGPLTPSGVYQAIERRALSVGLKVHPHQFRHTFNHNWLAAGGAEGDLMELMGWDSPQMLRRYGRSARSARARRAYDRIEVMGGI